MDAADAIEVMQEIPDRLVARAGDHSMTPRDVQRDDPLQHAAAEAFMARRQVNLFKRRESYHKRSERML